MRVSVVRWCPLRYFQIIFKLLTGFIDDDEEGPSTRTTVTRPVYRWRDLASDGAELMESLAQAVRERYPRPPALETISEPIVRLLPAVTDPGIWRVRVKVSSST
jgi:hypothetical protein